jgi:hypothetical protein
MRTIIVLFHKGTLDPITFKGDYQVYPLQGFDNCFSIKDGKKVLFTGSLINCSIVVKHEE